MNPSAHKSPSAAPLGVVLAGGTSQRFGSDKALAEINGVALIDHAVATLQQWCVRVIVVGRDEAPVEVLPDWPRPGLGPLGGIAAALRYADQNGFETLLSCGVDSLGLPGDLLSLLGRAPAFAQSQPVIGHWPASAFGELEAILKGSGRHSMFSFAERIGARPVALPKPPGNINAPEDLERFKSR